MNKDQFRSFVKQIISEVKKEKSKGGEVGYADKKVSPNSYLNGEKNHYTHDVDPKSNTTVHALLNKIKKTVRGIDKNIAAKLDDHNDITVLLPGIFKIRIRPNFENNYNIEAFRNMTDRVYAIGLDEKQVMNFIRVNFAVHKKGSVQKAYDKSMDNLKDKTEKKSAELPKTEKVKNLEPTEKEKEDAVSNDENPQDEPMRVAEEPKRQEDHDVEKNKVMPKIQKMIRKTSKEEKQ